MYIFEKNMQCRIKMNQEDTSISPFDPLGHPVFLVLDHKPAFKPFS